MQPWPYEEGIGFLKLFWMKLEPELRGWDWMIYEVFSNSSHSMNGMAENTNI